MGTVFGPKFGVWPRKDASGAPANRPFNLQQIAATLPASGEAHYPLGMDSSFHLTYVNASDEVITFTVRDSRGGFYPYPTVGGTNSIFKKCYGDRIDVSGPVGAVYSFVASWPAEMDPNSLAQETIATVNANITQIGGSDTPSREGSMPNAPAATYKGGGGGTFTLTAGAPYGVQFQVLQAFTAGTRLFISFGIDGLPTTAGATILLQLIGGTTNRVLAAVGCGGHLSVIVDLASDESNLSFYAQNSDSVAHAMIGYVNAVQP